MPQARDPATGRFISGGGGGFRIAHGYVQFSQRGLEGSATAAGKLRDRFRSAISPGKILAGVVGGIGAGYAIKNILGLASSVERLQVSFEVLLGSAGAARRLMTEITEFAARTPFEQMELARAAKGLRAFRVEQEQIIPLLRRLGDMAALADTRLQDLVAIYGKLRSKGRLTMEEMNQLAERGVASMQDFSEVLKIPLAELPKQIARGAIRFEQFEKVLRHLTDEGGRFAGGMERISKTTAGLWSTVTGNFKQAMAQFGQSIIKTGKLKSILESLGRVMTTVGHLLSSELVQTTIKWTFRLAGAMGLAWAISKVISVVSKLMEALRKLAATMGVVQAFSGPKGWLMAIGGVVGAIAVVEALEQVWKRVGDSAKTAADESEAAAERIGKAAKKAAGEPETEVAKTPAARALEVLQRARREAAIQEEIPGGRTAGMIRALREDVAASLREIARQRLSQTEQWQGRLKFAERWPESPEARGIREDFEDALTGETRRLFDSARALEAELEARKRTTDFLERSIGGLRRQFALPLKIGGGIMEEVRAQIKKGQEEWIQRRATEVVGFGPQAIMAALRPQTLLTRLLPTLAVRAERPEQAHPAEQILARGVSGEMGLAELARTMQQEALNRLQERQLRAAEATAAGIQELIDLQKRGKGGFGLPMLEDFGAMMDRLRRETVFAEEPTNR